MKTLRFGLVGIAGYGRSHLNKLRRWERDGSYPVELASFSDLENDATRGTIAELAGEGKAYRRHYRDMLKDRLDAVIISTPLHMHFEMASFFLEQGIHVYLEKPPVVLLKEADVLLNIQRRTGALCQVGFQHASVPSVRRLVRRFRSGEFRRPRMIAAWGLAMRTSGYYESSPWKGRLQTADGAPIFDGTVMNPMAHLLNIALYFGEALQLGSPLSVRSELYRGRAMIESEDTCSAVFRYPGGIKLAICTSLCSAVRIPPTVRIVFDDAEVVWSYRSCYIRRYGGKMEGPHPIGEEALLENFTEALLHRAELYMPLTQSRRYVEAANSIFAAAGAIVPVPAEYVLNEPVKGSETATAIIGIDQIAAACAAEALTFSQLGVPWAVPSEEKRLDELSADWRQWIAGADGSA